jgi:hypothetical protein
MWDVGCGMKKNRLRLILHPSFLITHPLRNALHFTMQVLHTPTAYVTPYPRDLGAGARKKKFRRFGFAGQ